MPTYKHNDYYGYINKIQEKAIANPSWFWGNSPDASEVRQWLYNNGASTIVEDIYKNTPEEIQRKIPANYLSQDLQKQRYMTDVHNRNEEAGKTAAKVAAAVATAPSMIGAAVTAPIATAIGLIGGTAGGIEGSVIGSLIGNNIYSRGTENDGVGASISTNRKVGAEIGGLVGGLAGGIASAKPGMLAERNMLKKYGYENGVSFSDMLYNARRRLKSKTKYWFDDLSFNIPDKYEGWYHPAETFSSAEREAARNDWNGYLDNIQRWESRWNNNKEYLGSNRYLASTVSPRYNLNGVDDNISVSYEFNPKQMFKNKSLSESGQFAERINKAVDSAESALKYYQKQYNNSPDIHIDNAKISDSFHRNKDIFVGVGNDKGYNTSFDLSERWIDNKIGKNYDINFDETVGHELAHDNPLFNTWLRKENGMLIDADDRPFDSLYYGMDYSNIPTNVKTLLKPIEGVNTHDAELAESFSDAFGLRTAMDAHGIGNGKKYNIFNILRYKYTVPGGKNNRFLLQHPGLIRQAKALNATVGLKNGGIVKAQDGEIVNNLRYGY